jgi:hypothetical protein
MPEDLDDRVDIGFAVDYDLWIIKTASGDMPCDS